MVPHDAGRMAARFGDRCGANNEEVCRVLDYAADIVCSQIVTPGMEGRTTN